MGTRRMRADRPAATRSALRRSAAGVLGAAALASLLGCATFTDLGKRSDALERGQDDVVQAYEVERAKLAARQEREHARMEIRHKAEAAALDARLVAALNTSGRDLRDIQARLAAERRVFLADARARLRMIDARVVQIVETIEIDDDSIQLLEELGTRRATIEVGLHALDLVDDSSWWEARRVVSQEIGELARSVESLHDETL